MEDLWLKSQVQAPHHAKRSLVFKWRRLEGRAHDPPSLEGCDWSKGRVTDGFLGYKKKDSSGLEIYDVEEEFPKLIITTDVLILPWNTIICG